MLVHHPDPAVDRILRRLEDHLFAVQQDLALVGPVEAVEDVHQGGLAGAVLAEQGVYLAPPEVQVDAVVRNDPGKPLRDPAKLQDGGPFHAGRFYAGNRTARLKKERARRPAPVQPML